MKSFLYTFIKIWNDVDAVRKAARTNSTKPITNRLGRRIYGKATGRLAGKIFKN